MKCSPEQLAKNRSNGKKAEDYIHWKQLQDSDVKVLGRQVYVKVEGEGPGGRYIDILTQNKKTGELTAIEVKYNGAKRSAAQKAKDIGMQNGKGTFGKNAPRNKNGISLGGKKIESITVKEIKVSPEELAEWLR